MPKKGKEGGDEKLQGAARFGRAKGSLKMGAQRPSHCPYPAPFMPSHRRPPPLSH